MPIADKYRLNRQVGWSDEAEVHAGPVDPTHGVPVAVKIRHGGGGPLRPDGDRARFLRAVNDQAAAALAGCKQVAPIFETGQEDDNAFYVTKLYPRSLESLIQGRVSLDAAGLHRLTDGALKALEELRDKHGRAHGNLKPTNIFLEGKQISSSAVVLSDLALPDDANGEAADCYALGATLYQLLRSRAVRHFDWPMVHGPDWEKLGPLADAWRRFCNVLMAPDLGAQTTPLADVRLAFKKMKARANAAPSLSGAGVSSVGGTTAKGGSKKGLLAGAAATVAAVIAGAGLYLSQTNQKIADRLKGISGKLGTASKLAPALGGLAKNLPKLPVGHGQQPGTDDQANGTGDLANATPAADATPAVAVSTQTPTPTPIPINTAGDKWIGYNALLQRFHDALNDPAALDQPDLLNGTLTSFKENVRFQTVSSETTVGDFLRRLPPKLEATGDQPDLPANLWTKRTISKQEDIQTATYAWNQNGFQMQFNRIVPIGGNGPPFYLSATTVPVGFGVILAQLPPAAGKLQVVNGPVAWTLVNGAFGLRPAWLAADAFNPYYANTGHPTAESPMNGLSGSEAFQLARAAGCTLPTLAQWDATLNSPAGQAWTAQWQSFAKVRSPEWSTFAKGIQAKHATGSVLPNTQCFGDHNDLSAVGTTPDPNYFFEPFNTRVLKSFAHLIGNIGQYVVDDARNPTKYFFAGGSAESAPSVFQDLARPPATTTPFAVAADGGLRLAVAARGNGSEKNPALDKLKSDLDAELARVAKLL